MCLNKCIRNSSEWVQKQEKIAAFKKTAKKISLRPNSGHGCQESRNEMGKANLLILVFTRAAAIVLLVAKFVMHSSSIAATL